MRHQQPRATRPKQFQIDSKYQQDFRTVRSYSTSHTLSPPVTMSLECPAPSTTQNRLRRTLAPSVNYATSVKAFLGARHANTGRNKRPKPSGPWIGEMIVVKEYDQMDSLREILNCNARREPDTGREA